MQEFRLNAGSGTRRRTGYINIDIDPRGRPDVVCDLRALPFKSGTMSRISCNHVLEHLKEDMWLGHSGISEAVLEFSRVLRDDGMCEVEVPSPQGEDAVRWQHFTVYGHRRLLRIFRMYFGKVSCRGIGTWAQARFISPFFVALARIDPFWGAAYRFTLRKSLHRLDVVIYDRETAQP